MWPPLACGSPAAAFTVSTKSQIVSPPNPVIPSELREASTSASLSFCGNNPYSSKQTTNPPECSKGSPFFSRARSPKAGRSLFPYYCAFFSAAAFGFQKSGSALIHSSFT